MNERSSFFHDLLMDLQQAGSESFDKMKYLCLKRVDSLAKYSLPDAKLLDTGVVDNNSMSIYPKNCDFSKGFVPVKVYGDGNCLTRTGSLYAFGTEEMHIEMRTRIVFELCINMEWYLNNENISVAGLPKNLNSLYAQFSNFYKQGQDVTDKLVLGSVFQQATVAFSKSGAWGEMLHLLAMASVLRCNIFSIYPDLSGTKRDRKLYHRPIKPRMENTNVKASLRIFWTHLNGMNNNEQWWTPNHFVACLKEKPSTVNCLTERTNAPGRKPVTLMDFLVTSKHKQSHKLQSKNYKRENRETVDAKLTDMIMKTRPLSYVNETNTSQAMHDVSKQKNEHGNGKTGDLLVKTGPNQSKKDQTNVNEIKTSQVTHDVLEHILKNEHENGETGDVKMTDLLVKTEPNQTSQVTHDDLEQKNEHGNGKTGDLLVKTGPNQIKKDQTNMNEIKTSQVTHDVLEHILKEEQIDSHEIETKTENENDYEYVDDKDVTLAYCFPDENMHYATPILAEMTDSLSFHFYQSMGVLAAKNHTRDDVRQVTAVQVNENDELLSLKRNHLDGKIEKEVNKLKHRVKLEIKRDKRAHLHAIIACGEYILENGPLVKTQVLSQVLAISKMEYLNKPTSHINRKMSAEVLESISKYLPVMQIYIHNTGYILEYREGNIQKFVDSIANSRDLKEAANENLEKAMKNFKDYVSFMDTYLDKSVLKAILVELFSVNAVSRLNGAKCKQTLQRARDEIPNKMIKYKELEQMTLTVRSDMNNQQQHMLHKRSLAKLKAKTFKARASGGGREKMCEKFPQLSEILELAFGEGSKIHPRLTTETRFRSPDMILTMPKAREILLSVAGDKIPNIALSTCYTYTENYRMNTRQADRHHKGQNVNANISLKKLPRIGMVEERINAHYCRSNVNYHLERSAECKDDYLVDAKDAKGIVCADIDPVQNMGKSWKKTTRMDHQFDQSRTNACTPMTHLFMETVSDSAIETDNLTVMNVVRSGQPVTLINISFYEPETVYRCFNELFLLLTIPALDVFFRNPKTGGLKKNWIFVVDNGPSEAPSSSLVRMLLVRLVNFLKLDKVLQISFENLNSKDNPAERPHASENLALSRHGPFKTMEIFPHKNAKIGSKEHQMNMEEMAKEVISCIRTAKFGGKTFFSFRGVKDHFIFNDEKKLRNFLKLSEQGKDESLEEYSITECPLQIELCKIWDLNTKFTGTYIKDYNHLSNSLIDNRRTSWLTDYMASIYSLNPSENSNTEFFEREPLPDYMRWLSTNELHYMTYEDRRDLEPGEWDQEAIFTPSKIIGYISCICIDPPPSILPLLALLAWVTPEQLTQQLNRLKVAMEKQLNMDKTRDLWKNHKLFKNTVADLVSICKEEQIPHYDLSTKLELIEAIAKKKNIEVPDPTDEYNGDLNKIPTDCKDIANFSIGYLRSVLFYHNINWAGTKDELVLKVFLLRHKRLYLINNFAEDELRKRIIVAGSIIVNQRRSYNKTVHILRRRKFSTLSAATKNVIHVSEDITNENLHRVFDPLLTWLNDVQSVQQEVDAKRVLDFSIHARTKIDFFEQCKETGAKVKVFWERRELGTTVGKGGWSVGWYNANVISYDEDTDSLNIEYLKEEGSVYTVDFSVYMSSGKLKFISSPLMQSRKANE